MIVGIDIGNTTVEVGLIENPKNIHSYKLYSDKNKTEDEWYLLFNSIIKDKSHIEAVLISSVVPQITDKIKNAVSKATNSQTFIIGEHINYPIKINYTNPEEVGTDRIVNAVAVINQKKYPSIVVDFGTAVTFDYINKKGEYEGGAIFPGIKSSIEALFSKTAKLPSVSLKKISNPIGKNTIESIQTGIYNGYISIIEGMVSRIKDVCECKLDIILTGGDAYLIKEGLKIDHSLEPYLNMKGIYFIYKNLEKNLLSS
ncbi:MAG: type III pantothenate kinase [Aquificae bacterium]|nr:type III pantothenate kinase [Aquificota bacterium]